MKLECECSLSVLMYRTDTDAELHLICELAKQAGAFDAVRCTHWADGGAGATELGKAVQKAAEEPSNFSFLYDTEVASVTLPAHLLYFTVYTLSVHFVRNFMQVIFQPIISQQLIASP